MEFKSNLDLRLRLKIATKNIDKAISIIVKHTPDDTPFEHKKVAPLAPKECGKAMDLLTDSLLAIGVIQAQMAGTKAEHCLNFPSQNKQLKKLFGNHHVQKIDKITKQGNNLIFHLGKKRKAMTAFLDVLNDKKYRKDSRVENNQDDIDETKLPKNLRLRNSIPKGC